MRRLLSRIAQFVDPDIAVVEAANAAEALVALGQRPFSLVLTDYHMPGGTGLDVVLAAHAQDPERPIVVVSAQSSVEAAALAAGATMFVAKPFTVEALAALLRSLLP